MHCRESGDVRHFAQRHAPEAMTRCVTVALVDVPVGAAPTTRATPGLSDWSHTERPFVADIPSSPGWRKSSSGLVRLICRGTHAESSGTGRARSPTSAMPRRQGRSATGRLAAPLKVLVPTPCAPRRGPCRSGHGLAAGRPPNPWSQSATAKLRLAWLACPFPAADRPFRPSLMVHTLRTAGRLGRRGTSCSRGSGRRTAPKVEPSTASSSWG